MPRPTPIVSFGLQIVAPRHNNELHVDSCAGLSNATQSPEDVLEGGFDPSAGKDKKEKKHRTKEAAAAMGMSYRAYTRIQDAQNTAVPHAAESEPAQSQIVKPQEVTQSQALGKTPGKNARRRPRFRALAKGAGISMTQCREQLNARKEDGRRFVRHDEDVEAVKACLVLEHVMATLHTSPKETSSKVCDS